MLYNIRTQTIRTRTENRQHAADLEQFDLEIEELVAEEQLDYQYPEIS
jgi:hypothetical protein